MRRLLFVAVCMFYGTVIFSQTTFFKTYGNAMFDCLTSIQSTSDGNFIIMGYISHPVDSVKATCLLKVGGNGDTLWTKIFETPLINNESWSLLQTSDGGYVIGGMLGSGTGSDIFLLKTNAAGDTLWTRTFSNLFFYRGRNCARNDWRVYYCRNCVGFHYVC